MLKLSEVCEKVGVTRRTLQEYAKIGLLEPTKKTMGGYWYYDDDAVTTLEHILIFVEAGYERKQIKEIINKKRSELLEEYEKAITLLREKQERIGGMICTLEILKTAASMSVRGADLPEENQYEKTKLSIDFLSAIRQAKKELGRFKNVDASLVRFMTAIIMLFHVYTKGASEEKLRHCIDHMYDLGMKYIPEEYEDPEGMTDDELKDGVTEFLEEILEHPDGISLFDKHFGEGTSERLMGVIHEYKGFVEYEDDEDESDETSGE